MKTQEGNPEWNRVMEIEVVNLMATATPGEHVSLDDLAKLLDVTYNPSRYFCAHLQAQGSYQESPALLGPLADMVQCQTSSVFLNSCMIIRERMLAVMPKQFGGKSRNLGSHQYLADLLNPDFDKGNSL